MHTQYVCLENEDHALQSCKNMKSLNYKFSLVVKTAD